MIVNIKPPSLASPPVPLQKERVAREKGQKGVCENIIIPSFVQILFMNMDVSYF